MRHPVASIVLVPFLASALVAATASPLSASDAPPGDAPTVSAWVENRLATDATVPIIVRFDTSPVFRSVVRDATRAERSPGALVPVLIDRARRTQRHVRALLDDAGVEYRALYLVNGIRLEADREWVDRLVAAPGVVRVVGDPAVRSVWWTDADASDDPSPDATEWGIRAVRADDVWAQDGVRGEGFVVASADTGVEWEHPAIRSQYRGFDGETAAHDYHWHDPIAGSETPLDDHDHGTHTTGTMVGDDGSGNQIGVAPAAQWVGCRNMDSGVGRPSTYIECMEYFMAPWPHGGDPELDGDPTRAPDVINNSWGCPSSEGCDPDTLHDAVAAVDAAGILFVASAGNSGPFCSSVNAPPAIYAESYVVGATESSGALAFYSSKGPVTVDGSNRMRPDLSAPGSGVRSAVRGGGYASFSGTSMAGPHVAGAAALFWSAKPALRDDLELTRCVLSRTAQPNVSVSYFSQCGGTGPSTLPNHLFGWGRLDVYEALHPTVDADGDSIVDGCDCAPSDAGAFAAARVVRDVRFVSATSFEWGDQSASAGTATTYDVARGALGTLRATGSTSDASCVATGLAEPALQDFETPIPEDGFYYLIRAINPCATSSWGAGSSGADRSATECP